MLHGVCISEGLSGAVLPCGLSALSWFKWREWSSRRTEVGTTVQRQKRLPSCSSGTCDRGEEATPFQVHTCGPGPICTATRPWLAQVKALLFPPDILHPLDERLASPSGFDIAGVFLTSPVSLLAGPGGLPSGLPCLWASGVAWGCGHGGVKKWFLLCLPRS